MRTTDVQRRGKLVCVRQAHRSMQTIVHQQENSELLADVNESLNLATHAEHSQPPSDHVYT